MNPPPPSKDKPLFTPGPLTTSMTVKQAMLRDLGSRDHEFISAVQWMRDELLRIAGVSREDGYEAIPMQGSGTFGIEAVISSTVPRAGKMLIIVNGAYGQRMNKICRIHGISTVTLEYAEDSLPDLEEIDRMLAADDAITNVAVVHCETTTGIMNPIESIGQVVKKHDKVYFVDSMSAFGAVVFDLAATGADYLVSSANKNIEGVPGFSFCIARRSALDATDGLARTLTLDLLDQLRGLENNGQFRFTPPTHAILAFNQALRELEGEGGVPGRAARYRGNYETLIEGMRAMGFEEYLIPEVQGHIITSFRYPDHPNFDFEKFYNALNDRGFVIYPGKVSNADCFRIGNIGRVFKADVQGLLSAIWTVLFEMDVQMKEVVAG